MRRWLFLSLALALVLIGGIIWVWQVLPTIKLPDDLKQRVERYATAKLGRPVTIGSLHVYLKNPIYVEVKDLLVTNPAWASTADMMRIGSVIAEVDVWPLWPLLNGQVRFHRLEIDGAQVVLERNTDGSGNWKSARAIGPPPSLAKTPDYLHAEAKDSRAHVPVVLVLAVRNSWITFRTSSGQILKIDLNKVALRTDSIAAPVGLLAEGGYNGIPVKLDVAMQSFDAMHDVDVPFHADITAMGAGGVVTLNADMMDPLNFDNFHSTLDAKFENVGRMAEIFGTHFRADMPIALAGAFQHDDREWHIENMAGRLDSSNFTGNMQLNEGERLHADRVGLGLDFDRLSMDDLMKKLHAKRELRTDKDKPLFHVERKPGTLLDARLDVKDFVYKIFRMADLKLRIQIEPGLAAMKDFSATFLRGKVQASLVARAVDNTSDFTVMTEARGVDLAQLFQLSGLHTQVLTGKVDVSGDMTARGETEDALKKTSHGEMVVSMTDGAVSRKIMQQASVDIGGLFGYSDGMGKLRCLLTVMRLDRGVVSVTPLRIKSVDGTLFSGGWLDLKNETLNFQLRTDPQSTGFFALDLPISITGKMDKPVIEPIFNSNIPELKAEALSNVQQLTPAKHDFIAGNDCGI